MVIKVSFANFWEGFPLEENFFTDVIQRATGHRVISVIPLAADLVIWSVFGANGQRNDFTKLDPKKINWYFTGENYPPDIHRFDLSFSFSREKLSKHFRIPIWWLYCDWSGKAQNCVQADNKIDPRILHKFRNRQVPKEKKVSIFINNPEPKRLEAVEKLERVIPVMKFGGFYGNRVRSKLEIGKDYRFNLCFENAKSAGYHTEKLLHAWSMGAVPLYFGDESVNEEFNSKCFVNLNDFSSLDEFCDYVMQMTDEECERMINEPLLKEAITLESLYSRLRLELSSFSCNSPRSPAK